MYCFAWMKEAFRLSRQNRLMLLMCMAGLSQQQRPQLRRRAWVWPRPQNKFRLLIANPALNFLWKEHFCVTHRTFEYLCDLVRVGLQEQQVDASANQRRRKGRLATGNSYRSCGLQFAYGKSSAHMFLTSQARKELLFWRDNLRELNGVLFWPSPLFPSKIVFSDASASGVAAFIQGSTAIFLRNWSSIESQESSMWRALVTFKFALEAFVEQ